MRYAAAGLLLFAAACSQDLPARASASRAARAHPFHEGAAEPDLVNPGDSRGSVVARRNVFAYAEPPRVSVTTKQDPVAQPAASTVPLGNDLGAIPPPQRFEFPYRYIGRFGPENAQLAAFVAGGQATVVKTGEVLGGKFLVKTIGLESVEVSLLSDPAQSKRLDVGQ